VFIPAAKRRYQPKGWAWKVIAIANGEDHRDFAAEKHVCRYLMGSAASIYEKSNDGFRQTRKARAEKTKSRDTARIFSSDLHGIRERKNGDEHGPMMSWVI